MSSMARTLRNDPQKTDELIASSVRQLLAARELAIADLSYHTGLPMSTVYKKLNGGQAWKSADIARVALYLGVSPNDLFSGHPLPRPSRRTGAAAATGPAVTPKASGRDTARCSYPAAA